MALLSSIPSPSFNSIDIGPLSLNIYGLAIALGVVAAVWLGGRRFEERGVGTSEDASSITVWAVLAGVVGARLYHVATDWERFEDNLGNIPKIWEGGLGIPGGLAFGIPVGLYLARRRGIPISTAATCAAPSIPLAQAIGRLGNYFNQELYGRATDLPWALEIDADHLVTNPATGQLFAVGTTFHPTFLYELLWNLGVCAMLVYVDKRWRPGGGSLMGLYVAAYGLGRFWVEGLRVDPADDLGPFRWNQWVALAAVVVGAASFLALRGRPEIIPERARDGDARDSDDGVDPFDEERSVTDLDLDDDTTDDVTEHDDTADDETTADGSVSTGVPDDELDGHDVR